MTSHSAVLLLLLWLACEAPPALAQGNSPADSWLGNRVAYPAAWVSASLRSNQFAQLRAEAAAGRLVVNWTPEAAAPTNTVVLITSTADLSHWPTRDWRKYPMTQLDARWQAVIPVEDPDVPIAYFVAASDSRATNRSPQRGVLPRAAGLDEPTRIFWPFLEGFEQGLESWRILSKATQRNMMETNATARSGHSSLSVALPADRRSVSVATTRVRGWQARAERATGLRVWLRTREGSGRAQFSLITNSGATNETIAPWNESVPLSNRWQKVELPFASLPGLALNAVDLFAIDFTADRPTEFLIDDLQFLGPWKLDLE